MEKLNCELFQFTVEFDQKNFKEKLFKKETDSEEITDNTFVAHSMNKNEHAHMEITFDEENSRLDVNFHNGGFEVDLKSDDVKLEDFVKDVSKFFTKKKLNASVTAIYKFNEDFTPLIKLLYPLLLGNNALSEAIVTGYELGFPNDPILNRMFISTNDNSITILMSADFTINLQSFDVYVEIERFAEYAKLLVQKSEKKK